MCYLHKVNTYNSKHFVNISNNAISIAFMRNH